MTASVALRELIPDYVDTSTHSPGGQAADTLNTQELHTTPQVCSERVDSGSEIPDSGGYHRFSRGDSDIDVVHPDNVSLEDLRDLTPDILVPRDISKDTQVTDLDVDD